MRRAVRVTIVGVAVGCGLGGVAASRSPTVRTTAGYLRTLVGKYTPLVVDGDGLDDVYNYVPISDRIATSGQPTAIQLRWIADAGYRTVINLLPSDSENSLPGEAELVAGLGMDYIHIPVDFKGPQEADYQRFVEAMRDSGQEPVWVHCAANARVSAFMYRYRTQVLGDDLETARRDVARIWNPFGAWARFLS